MTPEQEKKWKEEFKTYYKNRGYLLSDEDYKWLEGLWIAARKAAQVEVDELRLEKKFFEDSLTEARNEIVEIKPKIKVRDAQIKDRDQEIERLNRLLKAHDGFPTLIQGEFTQGLKAQLKERDELIKEAIPWIETNHVYYKVKMEWLEKARKLVGEG